MQQMGVRNKREHKRPAAGVLPKIAGFFWSVGCLHTGPSRQAEPSPSQMPRLPFSL